MSTPVSLDDLEQALMRVSSAPESEAAAFVSRATGKGYCRSVDGPMEADCPADIEDGAGYIAVPHRNDLDLGRSLVLRFVDAHLPHAASEVRHSFARKGAYGRFKSLLIRHRLIDAGHDHERDATRFALERWAREQGFEVEPSVAG